MKMYDYTEWVCSMWKHFDKILDKKIEHIHELTGIDRSRLIKINPAEFIRDKWDEVYIKDYNYQKCGDWVACMKTPENFLISPIDEDIETANQILYKTGQVNRKIRAHKCTLMPIPNLAARRFFVKNHRQSIPPLTGNAINYALVYENEVVAVMTYDTTGGAVRGFQKAKKYELLRLSIKHGTQINGGASKLQKKCEECIRHQGCTEIFSYSNATINEGNVYKQLGFTQSAIETGQAYVVEKDFRIRILPDCGVHGDHSGAKNSDIIKRGAIKVHITANRTWIKNIEL